MFLLSSLLLTSPQAKPLGWLQSGAAKIELDGSTDLALYRGPETQHLPAVAVKIPVPDQEELRGTLAIVDLAGGWSTLTLEAANALGVPWEWEQVRGEWHRLATIERVVAGNLVLHEVHVEVITEGPAGFVLGVPTLGSLGVAILPSQGLVRVAPAREADALLEAIATPIDVRAQPTSSWTDHDTTFRGNGVTLRVPGALRWGAAVSEGTFHVRTAQPTSRVARSRRLPPSTRRADLPYHDVEARLGEAWLDHTWILETDTLSDPDPLFAAELGYDVLYGLDIAVAGGRMAFAKAREVKYKPAREVAVALAQQRFEQEEARKPTEAPVEGRVQIGFDGPAKAGQVPLGDPGDPAVRDRNLDLAETLWLAGKLDAALPYYLAASQHAGDHCLTHLRLAQRRLAWSGTRQAQSFVADLIRQPLERAGYQWNTWLGLDEDMRRAIAEGQDLPDAPLQVYQPTACQQAWGLLLAAYTAQGNDDAAKALSDKYRGKDPAIDYARGLRHLARAESNSAQPLVAASGEQAGVPRVDAKTALALASVSTPDRVKGIARELPQFSSDHELTTAFAALEAGRGIQEPQGVARALRRADDRWLPGNLVVSIALGEPPPPWDERLAQRFAGAPQIEAWRAVHQALEGHPALAKETLAKSKAPAVADWWTAKAVVSWLTGDEAGRVEALEELHLRFPLLPGTDLGTLPVAGSKPD